MWIGAIITVVGITVMGGLVEAIGGTISFQALIDAVGIYGFVSIISALGLVGIEMWGLTSREMSRNVEMALGGVELILAVFAMIAFPFGAIIAVIGCIIVLYDTYQSP